MGKFRKFYDQLLEEKLLKLKKEEETPVSGELTEPTNGQNALNDILKANNKGIDDLIKGKQKGSSDGILKTQKRDDIPVVAKPVFNKVQKRNDLSVGNEIEETVNFSTKLLDSYPTGPINLGNSRLIKTPQANTDTEGTYQYDVIVSPKSNLFSFVKESPITIQLNENGVMRFENEWDETAIRREIKKIRKKIEKDDEDNVYRMVEYLKTRNKSDIPVIEEFFRNMTDYYLFWKFDEKLNSIRREDYYSEEQYQEARDNIQKNIDELEKKPSEEDFDKYVKSQEFYDVLKKMGDITRSNGLDSLQVLSIISKPKYTYFYPTLIDVIRLYDEGETNVKELPTTLVKTIDSNDENNPFGNIGESLYTDVMLSLHSPRNEHGDSIHGVKKEPYTKTNPENTSIFTNEFGKDMGEIVYEFVSVKDNNWNRITDKGVLIGYGKQPDFNSIDIHTCFCMAYCDIPDTLKEVTKFNPKYKDPKNIPIWLLKVGLDNVVTKRVAADHKGSLKGGKPNTRRFID